MHENRPKSEISFLGRLTDLCNLGIIGFSKNRIFSLSKKLKIHKFFKMVLLMVEMNLGFSMDQLLTQNCQNLIHFGLI